MNILAWTTKRVTAHTLLALDAIVIVITVASQNILINLANAETGKGTDVFKVIMTIFGVDKSKGDVIAMVITNNGEASRVKFLEVDAPYVIPLNTSGGETGGHLVEYVATFPNVTVNAGAEYNACIMTTKDLELICKTGHNSPASRPEFIDINLDEAILSGTEQAGDIEEEMGTVTNNEGSEGDD